MRRGVVALFGACVLGVLALIFWQLEYQHVSLVLWLLVIVALLGCCVQIAVSLSIARRRRRAPVVAKRSRSRSRQSILPLVSALALGLLGVVLWQFGVETTGQLFWFLVIVVLLWGCVQVSLLLQPRAAQSWRGYEQDSTNTSTISTSWSAPQVVHDRLFPGTSLPSGMYNEGNEKVWDSNESLPPH